MLDLVVERRAVVRLNGDVDELLALRFANPTTASIPLDHAWIEVPVTDAHCDVVSVSDGLPGNPEWQAGELDQRFLVALRARDGVPPHGERLLGVHVLCRERCTVEADRITFRDPFLPGDLGPLGPTRLEVSVGVIFPDAVQLRRIRAEHALEVTSRGARWSFTPTAHRPHQLYACAEPDGATSATWLLDDVLAALHECIALDACGEPLSGWDGLRASLEDLGAQSGTPMADSAALADLLGLPILERQRRLCRALRTASQPHVRRRIAERNLFPSASAPSTRRTRGPRYALEDFQRAYQGIYATWKDTAVSDRGFTEGYVLEELREHGLHMARATLYRYLTRLADRGISLPAMHTQSVR